MATYAELYGFYNDAGLRNRVRVAISIAAEKVNAGDDNVAPFDQTAGAHDARAAWVKNNSAFNPSETIVQNFWNAMLASNRTATTTAITSATDSTIQNNVDAVVDIFASGETA